MQHQENKKVRVGILIDSFEVAAWVYVMLEEIMRSDYATLDLVVLNDAQKSLHQNYWTGLRVDWEYLLYNLYRKLDRWLYSPAVDAFSVRNAATLLGTVPVIKVKPDREKYADVFTESDVEKIKKHGIDVLIRLGFRILKGDILSASKFGIWSYHNGDSEYIRGGPSGFWEVFENHAVTGATLQILTDELDKGPVLSKTFSSTAIFSVSQNRSNSYWNALSLLPRKLQELQRIGEQAFIDKIAEYNRTVRLSSRIRTCPKNREFFIFFVKKILLLARYKLSKLCYLPQWGLMFDLGDAVTRPFRQYKKLMAPRDRFWADPFVIYKDNRYYIYVEEMKYNDKGHISLIVMDEQGHCEKPVRILEKPYHLSYPFIFSWQGNHYMIPESGANRTVDVYRLEHFPAKWTFHATLLSKIKAADTTLYFYQNRWWLFTNIQQNMGTANWVELFLFYADSPFSDNWISHPQNPIVSDVRRARPAGSIYEQHGKLFRPAQDCSKTYGYGIRVHQILTMNEQEYHEVEVRYIEPDWDSSIKGIHTINKAHNLTIVDVIYKRPRLVWYLAFYGIPIALAGAYLFPDSVVEFKKMIDVLKAIFI